jgi:hypothetical protein
MDTIPNNQKHDEEGKNLVESIDEDGVISPMNLKRSDDAIS